MHAEGGKILLQILHAGRYAYHPFSVSASSIKAPINPFKPRALRGVDGNRRLRRGARAGPRGRLRRRRDDGLRGLPDQPVPGAAHEQAHRRLGRHAGEAAAARRSRSSGASARPSATTSSSSTGCRWPTRSRAARAGTRSSRWQQSRGGRRDDHQHRHRLARGAGADHRHLGARGAFVDISNAMAEHVEHPGGRVEPHQHAAGGRADARRRATRT